MDMGYAKLSQMVNAQRISGRIAQTGFGKSLKLALIHYPRACMSREIAHMQLIDDSVSRMRELW
ncbi:hypothetical protein D3C72_2152040 [compost metagenome]